MSPSMLHAKLEEFDTFKKRENFKIGIIGCSPIGILHACLFAEAGFKVVCGDTDQTIVNLLRKGKASFMRREVESKLKKLLKSGYLSTVNDIKRSVSQSDIIIIPVTWKIDEKKNIDYSEIEDTCRKVASVLRSGSLVIILGVAGFGFTEGVIKEVLESSSGLRVGTDFGLAYVPTLNGQTLETLVNRERIVAATEKDSLNSASNIIEVITKKSIKKTLNVKIAELAVLFRAVKKNVDAALDYELAIFCEKAACDYNKIFRILNIDGSHTASFPNFTEENGRKEAYLLFEGAENLNVKLRIPVLARKINKEMVRHATNLVQSALRDCGKTLRRTRVALLGIAKKPNIKTALKTTVKTLAARLEGKGAKINLHDRYFVEKEVADFPYPFKRSLIEALEDVDCAIILTGHDYFKRLNLKKLKVIMKMPAAIVDFERILDPDKVEKEGFIYRGLGKGD